MEMYIYIFAKEIKLKNEAELRHTEVTATVSDLTSKIYCHGSLLSITFIHLFKVYLLKSLICGF